MFPWPLAGVVLLAVVWTRRAKAPSLWVGLSQPLLSRPPET